MRYFSSSSLRYVSQMKINSSIYSLKRFRQPNICFICELNTYKISLMVFYVLESSRDWMALLNLPSYISTFSWVYRLMHSTSTKEISFPSLFSLSYLTSLTTLVTSSLFPCLIDFNSSLSCPISCISEPIGIVSSDFTLFNFLACPPVCIFFFQIIFKNYIARWSLLSIIFVSQMNLSQIRNKYKQILDDSDDSSSQEEKEIKPKVQLSRARVLTEVNENLNHSQLLDPPSAKVVISLKERIAQGIKNLGAKEEEVSGLKQQIARMEAKNKLLEEQLAESKRAVEREASKVIDERVRSGSLQAEIAKLQQSIESSQMQKELIFKQIDFYKRQITTLKSQKSSQSKLMQNMERQMKQVQKLKSMNHRLKDDLKRMHIILNEYTQKPTSKKIENKHYLGKPYKEHQCWFPQNLIGEVELFLKKEQVAQGNKKFLDNLVKFIDSYSKQVKPQKRLHSQAQKEDKTRSRLHSSSSLCERSNSTVKTLCKSSLKQSILLSRLTKHPSKKCTQSLLYSPPSSLQIKCEQILSEFYKIMSQAIQQKDLKKRKLLRLTEQMSSSILSLFNQQSQIN